MGFSEVEGKERSTIENGGVLKKPNLFGVRHVQGIYVFFGILISYFLKINISAAIVPMTQPDNNGPFYNWDSGIKSLILSSFYWGYVAMQFPAGLLARRYGAKIVYSVAMVSGGIFTILCPLAASIGNWELLVASRVFIGLSLSGAFPCTHTMLSKWAPITERSFLSTTIYSGAQLGTVIVLATSGFIFTSMGWPALFYITGAVSIAWGIFYFIFGCNEPAQSKIITKEEQQYIEALTGHSSTEAAPKKIPFKAMLTSAPFYALIVTQISFGLGFYTLLTELPSYLSHCLSVNIQSNSLLSSLPYFSMWIFSFIISPISDMLINRRILQVETSRKLFNTLGQWVPMICLIALGYVTSENQVLGIAILTISSIFSVACFCGYLLNHIDLSPNFAGTLMGISNAISSISALVGPLIVGAIVTDESDASQWRIVFFLSAGAYLIGNGVFLVFGKANVQPWDSVSSENSNNGKEITT